MVAGAGALPCWDEHRDAESALNSAFGFACRNGHVTVAKELLELGADPTIKNPTGDTPFKQAEEGAHKIVIAWMKERGSEEGGPTEQRSKSLTRSYAPGMFESSSHARSDAGKPCHDPSAASYTTT